MKRRTRKTYSIDLKIPVIIVVILLFIAYSYCSRTSCEKQYDKTLEYVSKHYIEPYKGKGMNISSGRYFTDSVRLEFSLPAQSNTPSNEEIDERFISAMRDLVRKNETWLQSMEINTDLIENAQEEAYRKKALYNERVKTNYLLIPVIEYHQDDSLSENGVKNNCHFTITFKLFIDKNAREQVLYNEIGQIINLYVDQLLISVQHHPEDPFDMCGVNDILRNNVAFMNEINNLCNRNREFLKLYNNPMSDQCSDQFFFGAGEFEVPPIYQPVMNAYFKIVSRYLKEHPNENYRLICRGYADAAPVRGSGIMLDPTLSIPYAPDSAPVPFDAKPARNIIRGSIVNNNQLSHVRAWMGISKLYQTLADTRQALPTNLSLWYQGAGESPQRDACKRKIQFHLVKIQ